MRFMLLTVGAYAAPFREAVRLLARDGLTPHDAALRAFALGCYALAAELDPTGALEERLRHLFSEVRHGQE